jgi:signal transduction histidine kinase
LRVGDLITLGGTVLQVMVNSFSEGLPHAGDTPVPVANIIPDELTFREETVRLRIPSNAAKGFAGWSPAPEEANKRLHFIYQIFTDFAAIRHLPTLLHRSLARVVDMLGAGRGVIMLLDERTGEMVTQATCMAHDAGDGSGISVSKTIVKKVFETEESILAADALGDERFQGSESIQIHKIRSTMCAPIKGQEKRLGVIYLDTRERLLGFTKDDLELFTAFSQHIGIIIENAQLISKLEQANRELKKNQDLLIASEKLSSLGRIAAGIAHEIFNPITSILGIVALMNRQVQEARQPQGDSGGSPRLLKLLEAEANRIIRIVESLTHFYRRRKSQLLPENINQHVEAALELASFQVEKGAIRIVKDLDPALPLVVADRDQLQIVFLNLVINARDAMENGGTLSIQTIHDKTGWVRVRFADTGYGIPDDIRDKIFEPLFTTKEEGKGTGLGLCISRDIVQGHGGTIDVESEVGKGTVFTVCLPYTGSAPD